MSLNMMQFMGLSCTICGYTEGAGVTSASHETVVDAAAACQTNPSHIQRTQCPKCGKWVSNERYIVRCANGKYKSTTELHGKYPIGPAMASWVARKKVRELNHVNANLPL